MLGQVEGGEQSILRIQDPHVSISHLPLLPDAVFLCILKPRQVALLGDRRIERRLIFAIHTENFDVQIRFGRLQPQENVMEVPELGTAVVSPRRAEVISGNLKKIISRRNLAAPSLRVGIRIQQMKIGNLSAGPRRGRDDGQTDVPNQTPHGRKMTAVAGYVKVERRRF